jgi:molybdate-binding protein/DNA-binding XRE family transcriptional regulator
MTTEQPNLVCHLKTMRQSRGWTQNYLAELVGIKRQAIYDIESGRYVPNTAVALELARHLGCKVEDLFETDATGADQPLTIIDRPAAGSSRVALARVRDRLVGYPLDGKNAINDGFQAADGFFKAESNRVQVLCGSKSLETTALLLGCDPAFTILSAHVSRKAPGMRVQCRFASSQRALEGLAAGNAHLAGSHVHNKGISLSNAVFAQKLLKGAKGMIIGFSRVEEGLMVAPGNPLGIRDVSDLARKDVRLVNRDPGAALRILLDDYLSRAGVPTSDVTGYDDEVKSHAEGAHRILYHKADAALGLRAVAEAFGLDFVTIESVGCDLVVPSDVLHHPTVSVLLDILQSRGLHRELSSLPGYDCAHTGTVIAEV